MIRGSSFTLSTTANHIHRGFNGKLTDKGSLAAIFVRLLQEVVMS